MTFTNLLHLASGWLHQLFTLNPSEPFKTGAKVVSMAGTVVTVGTTLATKTFPWLRAKIDSRTVSSNLGKTIFAPSSIERSIRYYIRPFCQSQDPAGGADSLLIHPVQNKLFATLDNILDSSGRERYFFLLADSGMGKSSALINYYVRHLHRWRKKYKLAVVPLGMPNADDKIAAIPDKENTVLFLDALDEDTLAMVDYVERIRLLIKATSDFPRVLITCRTQFFNKDEEIPKETGVLKIYDRELGEGAEYRFVRIYLTPFTDKQVKSYLRRRYPLWYWRKRKQAFKLVTKIPQLTARPMILAHIGSLLDTKRDFNYSFEVYEEMVNAWIAREKGFVEDSDQLRRFSELLAVDLFLNRANRGGEIITKAEIKHLAQQWGITIHEDKLSGRGLLNRDAIGNFKFAHRSIMEHLFIQNFAKENNKSLIIPVKMENIPVKMDLTDQMKVFLWEYMEKLIGPTHGYSSLLGFIDSHILNNSWLEIFIDLAHSQVLSIRFEDHTAISYKTLVVLLTSILSWITRTMVQAMVWLPLTVETVYKDAWGSHDIQQISAMRVMNTHPRVSKSRLKKRISLLLPGEAVFIARSITNLKPINLLDDKPQRLSLDSESSRSELLSNQGLVMVINPNSEFKRIHKPFIIFMISDDDLSSGKFYEADLRLIGSIVEIPYIIPKQ